MRLPYVDHPEKVFSDDPTPIRHTPPGEDYIQPSPEQAKIRREWMQRNADRFVDPLGIFSRHGIAESIQTELL